MQNAWQSLPVIRALTIGVITYVHAYSQSDGEGDLLISYTLKTKSVYKYLNGISLNQNIFMEYGIIILKYIVT